MSGGERGADGNDGTKTVTSATGGFNLFFPSANLK